MTRVKSHTSPKASAQTRTASPKTHKRRSVPKTSPPKMFQSLSQTLTSRNSVNSESLSDCYTPLGKRLSKTKTQNTYTIRTESDSIEDGSSSRLQTLTSPNKKNGGSTVAAKVVPSTKTYSVAKKPKTYTPPKKPEKYTGIGSSTGFYTGPAGGKKA